MQPKASSIDAIDAQRSDAVHGILIALSSARTSRNCIDPCQLADH